MKIRFEGSMPALITPFRDGAIDMDSLGRLVEFCIERGSVGLVPCGSTGESATLTHAEHPEVVRAVVKMAKGRVPVVAGTGSNSTTEAIALTKAAKEAGADAALLISPYYNRPTQEGIYRHYEAIAKATRFPLIVYNIPGRTGSKIEASTIARLSELDEIVGLKEATGSMDEAQDVVRLCGDRLALYAGDDSMTLPHLSLGAAGVISVIANIMPRESQEVVALAHRGEWAAARELHFRMMPLMRTLFLETNPTPIKAAAHAMGMCRDELRLPLLPMTEEPRKKLLAAMKNLGLI